MRATTSGQRKAAVKKLKAEMEALHGTVKPHVLLDGFELTDENYWICSCGLELYPDCDISLMSINECFEEHLTENGVDPETGWPA